MLTILLFKLYSCTSKLLHNSWIVKFWKIWIVCIFICGNVFWNSRQCMESLTCFTTNSIYMILEFLTISHNFCFVWWNLWHSPENFDKKKSKKWHLEAFAFKLWKLNHSKKIYPVISRLCMTSLSVDLHSPGVVSLKFAKAGV